MRVRPQRVILPDRPEQARWTTSEPGLLTARRGTQVIGYVVAVTETLSLAFDGAGGPIGRHGNMRAAQRSVERSEIGAPSGRAV